MQQTVKALPALFLVLLWFAGCVCSHSTAESARLTDEEVAAKLDTIVVPGVSFSGVPLSRALETLDELSTEDDGINILFPEKAARDPIVSITLRDQSLARILDFVTASVGYEWEIKDSVVLVVEQEPLAPGTVSATINNSETGEPIPAVKVTLTDSAKQSDAWLADVESLTALTDKNGRYEFTLIPAGRYIMYISKAGYKEANWDYIYIDSGEQVLPDFPLVPDTADE